MGILVSITDWALQLCRSAHFLRAAAGVGPIHGLAFASTLANLQLDTGPMALSILEFNVGTELMQLFVIILTLPWLILLGRTPTYSYVRISGALLASIAAIAWIIERTIGQTNSLTQSIEYMVSYVPYLLAGLALLAIYLTWRIRQQRTVS